MREWDWRLLGAIFLFLALPHFYRSYSIYLIGNSIPDTGALATVAQWGFIELLLEVIQETFVLAIFFFVGRSVIAGRPGESMRTAVTLVFWDSIIVAGALITFSGSLVDVIGTPNSIQETTTSFLRVKIAAIPITLLTAAIVIIVETLNRKRLILTVALANVGYRFVFDSLFYGGYPFSLGLGVMGVAWADVFASLSLLITAVLLLRRHLFDDVRTWREIFSVSGWRTYLGVSRSGIDSLVRNVAYFFLIVRLLNLLGEDAIGGYYLAIHIFWSFLLVPILALSESSKVLVANHSADITRVRRLWFSSMAISAAIVVVWVLLLPAWRDFATFLNPNEAIITHSLRTVSLLFVPYVLLAFNLVTDSVFYGIGKTRYMAYQSVVTNGTVYVLAFLAYLTGLWVPTFDTILILFTVGILVDSALTLYFVVKVLAPASTRFSLQGADA